jgi:succinyl-diaminopimelate desuccinylase
MSSGNEARHRQDRRVSEVIELASHLIRMPTVTNCEEERLDEVHRCGRFIADFLEASGLEVRYFGDGVYPAVLAGFRGALAAPVTLAGHFDVVLPEPDDSQFEPVVDGDYLWGRGAADMKTVVASNMVWMAAAARTGPPFPPFNLLLVGNEENGEGDPWGTPHVLSEMQRERGWLPELMIVGERTGERGDEPIGAVCPENRGILRMRLEAKGARGHSGTSAVPRDLVDQLIDARRAVDSVFRRHLTLTSEDGWETTVRIPFLHAGYPGVYNITAGEGVLGIEVRPIPADDLGNLLRAIEKEAAALGLDPVVELCEDGVACPPDNPHLGRLLSAVAEVSGGEPEIGRKKPGSSARFAPGGNAVVWGQSGIGPHSRRERHFLPSIGPYLEVLDALARRYRPSG